jgi:hypothetical protein
MDTSTPGVKIRMAVLTSDGSIDDRAILELDDYSLIVEFHEEANQLHFADMLLIG